ncbi:MAG: RNA polymerase sigma-70 factor [Bacteroidetes bacterium]|nr:RNA polymerase sigma-70 factor [Bacteroidota bacterium]MBS1607331.1 RNA polymerase sigma-70 factor [Bacteroidota bacterium]
MFKGFKKPAGEELFTSLFYTYKDRLFGYVFSVSHSRYIAEEITQEIFLKLWLRRHELYFVDNTESYLFTIARNKIFNYLRKAKYDEKLVEEIKNRMNPLSNNVEEQVSIAENNRLLQEAITLLSPQRQLVYQLSRQQGLNHEQIAEEMQLSRHTVKNHLVQALRFIKTYLDNKGIFIFLFFFLFA